MANMTISLCHIHQPNNSSRVSATGGILVLAFNLATIQQLLPTTPQLEVVLYNWFYPIMNCTIYQTTMHYSTLHYTIYYYPTLHIIPCTTLTSHSTTVYYILKYYSLSKYHLSVTMCCYFLFSFILCGVITSIVQMQDVSLIRCSRGIL